MDQKSQAGYTTKLFILCLGLIVLATMGRHALRHQAGAGGPLGPAAAIRRAQASERYTFAAEITQTTTPAAAVTAIGQRSRQDQLYLEGSANRLDRTMAMRLWAQGGSVLDQAGALELKVEGDGGAWARQGEGEWQAVENVAGTFAPGGDFFDLLDAAEGFAPLGAGPDGAQRYRFTVNSAGFSALMREQLERKLQAQGQLPAGVDLTGAYAGMTGAGELWVGSDGLPVRQILRLSFPTQAGSDEHVAAEISVTFTHFGAPLSLLATFGGWLEHEAILERLSPLLLLVALGLVLVRHRRSRLAQAAVTALVIMALVSTPLFQGFQMEAFAATLDADARTGDERAGQAAAQRELNAQVLGSTFDPHANPLQAPAAPRPALAPAAPATPVGQPDLRSGTDTDGDGLADAVETQIGTAPTEADSDGDSISDLQETQGFSYANTTWYLDPLALDSNNDGIDDRREWRRDGNLGGAPQDTDSDNSPDVFDLDNDNDGVNDRYDLSPFSTADTFHHERPFSFRLPDLQPGKLSYVEFQLRPTDTRHLWYALNVLDWPTDKRGQIQDSDNMTFAGTGDTSVPNTRNGDLKLLPMLEIRMDADNANQADPTTELQPYGIIVRDYDPAGATKVAYVPLTLQTDEEESRIAFNGKMIYKASGSWTKPHSVRMVWMVQALVDKCGDTAIKNDADCKSYRRLNDPEIIQIYPEESWVLAGMNVQEQHGTDIAVAYEDPKLDPARNDDTPLVALASGLEQSFLVGRDENQNGKRDLAVKDGGDTSLAARFGAGSTASAEQRWNLPRHLVVKAETYTHADMALRDITSVQSKALLKQYQTTDTPLLLFAREYRFRATNLDTLGLNGTVWEGPTQLALALNPRSEAQDVQTLASVNIAPYCHKGGAWQACAPTDYLAVLDQRLAPYVYQQANLAQGWGEATITEMYYMALQRGLSNVVQSGSLPLPAGFELKTDRLLGALIGQGLVQGGLWVAGQVTGSSAVIPNPQALTQSIGNIRLNSNAGISDLSRVGARIKGLSSAGKSKSSLGGVAVLLAVPALSLGVGAGLGVLGSIDLGGNPLAVQIVTGIFDIGLPALGALTTVFDFVKSFSSAKGPVVAVSKVTSVLTSGTFIAALGLLFELGTIWGLFIFQVASAGVPPGSPGFTSALSQTISATILAVILFAIGLAGGVGALLIAFASLADGIIKVVCNATGSTSSVCKGILGTLTEDINRQVSKVFDKLLIFSPSSIEIKPGTPVLTFAKPERGLTAGNRLIVSMPIETNIIQEDPSVLKSAMEWETMDRVKKDLVRATIQYELNSANRAVNASLNAMSDKWTVYQFHSVYEDWAIKASTTVRHEVDLKAGLNQPISLYLNVGYAIPSRTKVLIYYWDQNGTQGNVSSSFPDLFNFDVLPATLDEFYALAGNSSGAKLNWDSRFSTLKDADGDGLLATSQYGVDPDDLSWDSDGDQVSDAYELKLRARGSAISPTAYDTDFDDLSDRRELELGTDPARSDTDSDGLSDLHEINGWMVTVAGQQFKVRSDPASADSDSDGLLDAVEYDLRASGYHPHVANPSAYTVSSAVNVPDRVVAPGQTLSYTATVQNQVNTEWSQGALAASLPAALGGTTRTAGFVLLPNATSTFNSQFTIPAGATSQAFNLTTSVTAQVGATGAGTSGAFSRQHAIPLQVDANGPTVAISSLADGQRVQLLPNGGQLIIGGLASDQHSQVAKVEVNIDGAGWQPAAGTQAWSHPFAASSEGQHTIQARGTDRVGNLGPVAQIRVVVDNTAPAVAALSSGQLFANRNGPQGRWQALLNGTAGDPQSGGLAGSGIRSIEARLITTGLVGVDPLRNNDWQAGTFNNGAWTLNYVFPEGVTEPTGEFRFMIRATDNAGNTSGEIAAAGTLLIDASAPRVTFGGQPMAESALAAYAFEEGAGATFFADAAGRGNGATCAATACPAPGGGKQGQAAQFDGADDRLAVEINLPETAGGVAIWFKTGAASGGLFAAVEANGGHDRNIYLQNGNLCGRLWDEETICTSGASYADGAWHHVIHTYGGAVGGQRLYVDGVQRAAGSKTGSNFTWQTGVTLGHSPTGGFFNGSLDEISIFSQALTAEEARLLGNPLPAGATMLLPFDEPYRASPFVNIAGNGTPAQCSGNSCPTGAPGGTFARPIPAVLFNGESPSAGLSPYLSVGNAVNLGVSNSSFTVAAWVYLLDGSNDKTILGSDESKGVSQQLHLAIRNGKPHMGFYGNDLTGTTTLSTQTWYHIAWRYTMATGEQALFINGALDKAEPGHGAYLNAGPLTIGRWNNGNYFHGFMDEVAIYPRALELPEIRALQVNSLSTFAPLPGVVITNQTFRGAIADVGRTTSGVKQVEYVFVPAGDTDPQLNPLTRHRFEEAAGATVFTNALGHGSHGTCAGSACPTAGVGGRVGQAAQFDGADDRVTVPVDVSESSYGVAMWFKTSAASGGLFAAVAADGGSDRNLYLENGNLCGRIWHLDIVCTSGANYADGAWHHVVHTFGTPIGAQRLYVDGVQRASGSQAFSNFTWQTGVTIGHSATGGFFAGAIDDVQIFGFALSNEQARVLAQSAAPAWQLATLSQSGPGVTTATWSAAVPASMAGQYQLDLRATDMLGNQTLLPGVWHGEIDTAGPRASISYTLLSAGSWWSAAQYNLTATTEGYNLDPASTSLACYGGPIQRTYAPTTRSGETPRLVRMSATCTGYGFWGGLPYGTAQARAADRFYRVDEASTMVPGRPQPALAAQPPALIETAILTPASSLVLTATTPISLVTGLYAQDSIRDFTLTVDGVPIASASWASGAITATMQSASWTPAGEGAHRVQSTLRDWSNRTTTAQLTATLDLAPPSLALASTVLTQAHQLDADGSSALYGAPSPAAPVQISGSASDLGGVRQVQVRTNASDWSEATLAGSRWTASLPLASGTYTVSMRGFDIGGRTAIFTESMLVDVTPPALDAPTLTYRTGANQTRPLTPGMTIAAAGVRLNLDWDAASDAAGVRGYRAGWSTSPDPAAASLTAIGPAGPRHAHVDAGEAQTLYAHLAAEDAHGNTVRQVFGPFFVDAPATPDIADLAYHGWMDADRLLGVSRAVSNTARPDSALSQVQSFYTTWSTDTLRMAWTGANWDSSGDLFIYLDTMPGGATSALNPYTATTVLAPISLPGNSASRFSTSPMGADYLVQVTDAVSATLRRWDGAAWVHAADLGAAAYRLDTSSALPTTDLRLPFAWLGITDPAATPLGLVALASDEADLRLWAALPASNPLNSDQVDLLDPAESLSATLNLRTQYRWPTLGLGAPSSAGLAADTDLAVWISTEQPAVTASVFDPDLADLWDIIFEDEFVDPSDYLALLDPDLQRLGQGQVITYTVHVANNGMAPAEAITVSLESRRSLRLEGAIHEVDPDLGGIDLLDVVLEDIGPGAEATAVVTGVIDLANVASECPYDPAYCADYPRIASLNAFVYDASFDEGGEPLDWLWVDHQVDIAAPELEIYAWDVIPAGPSSVDGFVDDESAISLITLEVRDQDGAVASFPCPAPADADGEWNCAIDVGAASDGAIYAIRAQATDALGQASAWTAWMEVTVDTVAPTVNLDEESLALAGTLLTDEGYLLGGTVADNLGVAYVEVCRGAGSEEECADADLDEPTEDDPALWWFDLSGFAQADNLPEQVMVYAVDLAGNRSAGAVLAYRIDNIAPQITVTSALPAAAGGAPVLIGSTSDGSGVDAVLVLALPLDAAGQPLDDDPLWEEASLSGSQWSYTPAQLPAGEYLLYAMAIDGAGNAGDHPTGYRLTVADSGALIYLPLITR